MLIPLPRCHFQPSQDHQDRAGDGLGASALCLWPPGCYCSKQIKLEILISRKRGVFFLFFLLFSPFPSFSRGSVGSGARRAPGSSSAEGIGLQGQKSLHSGSLVLFCHVASGPGTLPVAAPLRVTLVALLVARLLHAGNHQGTAFRCLWAAFGVFLNFFKFVFKIC